MTFTTNELILGIVISGIFFLIIGVIIGCFLTAFKIEKQTYSTEPEKKSIRKETDEPTNY